MNGTKIDIETSDGTADAYASHPAGAGPWPAVILYMDALGLRETMFTMADRLASYGYFVLAPNMYYRAGAVAPFDPKQVFAGAGPETDRLMHLVMGVDDASAMRDTRAFLDFFDRDPRTRGMKVGTTGYCMGGGLAVCAACSFPDRIAAAASFHGAKFVTDPASPEIIARTARATFYIGVAEIDRRHDAQVTANLEAAFTKAGAPHTIELYAGASHGWAVPDLPVYDAGLAERHWDRTRDLFDKALKA